ncbi:MAG: DUF1080 domain-containing protein [Pirellulaceae bacterium]|nr:DUF1080 domain-containing protein [Planctomycetales bacterium]
MVSTWITPRPIASRWRPTFVLTLFALGWTVSLGSARAQEPAVTAEGVEEDEESERARTLFDGESLEGWKILDTTVYKRHGEVAVRDGAIRLGAGTPGCGIAWEGDVPRIDYELRLRARRVEGGDFFCGVTFPVNDQYCTLILGGWGGGATGLSNVDNLAAIENLTTDFLEFEQEQWYPVRLRVTGEKIQAWVGEKQIVNVVTADHQYAIWWEQEPARPLGITSWYTTAELKDIVLERLDSTENDE